MAITCGRAAVQCTHAGECLWRGVVGGGECEWRGRSEGWWSVLVTSTNFACVHLISRKLMYHITSSSPLDLSRNFLHCETPSGRSRACRQHTCIISLFQGTEYSRFWQWLHATQSAVALLKISLGYLHFTFMRILTPWVSPGVLSERVAVPVWRHVRTYVGIFSHIHTKACLHNSCTSIQLIVCIHPHLPAHCFGEEQFPQLVGVQQHDSSWRPLCPTCSGLHYVGGILWFFFAV